MTKCRRVCAICYCLERDPIWKYGQIAHIDRNNTNNTLENFAYLCLAHHDEYDSTRRQTRSLTPNELRDFKLCVEGDVQRGVLPAAMNSLGATICATLSKVYCKSKSLDGRALIYACIRLTNAGAVGSSIANLEVVIGDQIVADGDWALEAKDGNDVSGSSPAQWWRTDARWMTLCNSQKINPGDVHRYVAALKLTLPSSWAITLNEGEEPHPLPGSVHLTVIPVIGSPNTVQFSEIQSFPQVM